MYVKMLIISWDASSKVFLYR